MTYWQTVTGTNLIDELDRIKEKIRNQAEPTLKRYFNWIFENYPEVKMLRWHQYTPYFNDGEPCVFTVYAADIFITREFAEQNGFADCGGSVEDPDDDEGGSDKQLISVSSWSFKWKISEKFKKGLITQQQYDQGERIVELMMRFKEAQQEGIELFEYAFDDHVEVTAKANGIEVSEYSHD